MKAVRKKTYRLSWPVAIFLVAGLQAGCGQKGPLYLPDDEGENSHFWKPGEVDRARLIGKACLSIPDKIYYTSPGWRIRES
ncbi:MAG: lipoprotein-attachment site-containing protein [Candidatus Kentron sp. G]|nr:MAG: lipoprotein-attachment site-containing protein [Candidatus Kentron sp. G]VFN01230.1 MAG: lipoprotein-attachment site-containing protein [Candidatus Kentron sp. G]VFN05526.1 MAG: lipoprotein-attachment site-containing protein [Candidatus Kentron sp. G]